MMAQLSEDTIALVNMRENLVLTWPNKDSPRDSKHVILILQ